MNTALSPLTIPLALCAFALTSPAMAAGRDAPSPHPASQRAYSDPSEPGPYEVGVMKVKVRVNYQLEKLDCLLWYPAEPRPGSSPYVYETNEKVGAVSFTAVEDAPPLEPRELYPPIVYSHGAGGYNYQGVFLTEHLASHGYVVMAAAHPGNTSTDWNPTSMVTGAFTRPLDVIAEMDALEDLNTSPSSPLRGMIDLSGFGVTGFSFGGYTTLAVGGARFNFNPPRQRCAGGDAGACRLVDEAARYTLDDGFLDMSDPRVVAIAPMAPWTAIVYRDGGLGFVDVPTVVQGGGRDEACPMPTNIEPVWANVSGPKAIAEIYDAAHTSFSDNCAFDPDLTDCDDPFIDPELSHLLAKTWITAHFKVFVDGDDRYAPFLDADYAATVAEWASWREALGLP